MVGGRFPNSSAYAERLESEFIIIYRKVNKIIFLNYSNKQHCTYRGTKD